MIFEILVLLSAGILAGIVTGFIGASAGNVVVPLLVVLLNFEPYNAIGLALSIDVFASISVAYVFFKNKNIEMTNLSYLLIPALLFAIIGSYFSVSIPSKGLSGIIGLAIIGIGIKLYLKGKKPVSKKKNLKFSQSKRKLLSIFAGILIGLIAGILGGGGGIMILTALIILLNYKIHKAIGTSVLMMIFIAFVGGISHYYYSPFQVSSLLIASIGGIFGGVYSAKIANILGEKTLTKLVGGILFVLGLALAIKQFI